MRRLLAVSVLALVIVVLGVGQLVLPGLAASSLRDRLAHSGQVLSVSVSAFPAIELLWHQADRVVVRLGSYRSSPQGLSSLLDQASDTGSLSASAREVDTGLLTLRDATLSKSGSQLTGSALVTEADLRAALPVLDSVTPVASSGGALTLQGTASLFGVTATGQATVTPQGGRLVIAPSGLLGALGTIQVFSDPHLAVESVSAAVRPEGFAVQAVGLLH